MPGNADVRKNTKRKKNVESDKTEAATERQSLDECIETEDETLVKGTEPEQDERVEETIAATNSDESFSEKVESAQDAPLEEGAENGRTRESIEKIIGLKESLIAEVRALYNASFAKSGFGGGVDAVSYDLALYLARSIVRLKTDDERGKLSDEVMARAFSELKDAFIGDGPIKLPLAAKITVALDIHSGGNRTSRLCDTIYEIFKEAASLICEDELRAKELIGDLLSFVVGQGIKT